MWACGGQAQLCLCRAVMVLTLRGSQHVCRAVCPSVCCQMSGTGRLSLVQEELQWRLPPGGNRTPLKGVSVRPLPAVWERGFPVDLTRHNGRAHSDRRCHISRSEAEQLVHDSSNKEQPGSRRLANSSGESSWMASAMRMQGQTNCPLDEPPDPGGQQR